MPNTATMPELDRAVERWRRKPLREELTGYRTFAEEAPDPQDLLDAADLIFAFDFGTGKVNDLLAELVAGHWLDHPARTVVTQPQIERRVRALMPQATAAPGPLHLVLARQDQERAGQDPEGPTAYRQVDHLLPPRWWQRKRYVDTRDVVVAVRCLVGSGGRAALVIAQRDHLWRSARTVARAGYVPLIPPDLPGAYDPNDGQPHVRSAEVFRRREVGARFYYRLRGWI